MQNRRKIQIRLAALGLGVLFFLVPVSMTPNEDVSVTVKEACADQSCCPEAGSFCSANGEITPNARTAPSTGCQEQET